jgi:transposase
LYKLQKIKLKNMDIEIDPKMRFLILYRDVTQKLSEIHNITGIPLRTLYNWKEKLDKDENIFQVKEGRGRKRIGEELFSDIREEIEVNPQRVSARTTGKKFGIKKSTMARIFDDIGAQYKKVHVKKALTEEQRQERLKFCKSLLRNQDQIDEGFYADEMGIWLGECYKKSIWTFEEEPFILQSATKVKLNVWAAISSQGATSLEIFEENFDQKMYVEILSNHQEEMAEIFPNGYYYFHDSHPSHKAAAVKTWASQHDMVLNLLPPLSSDLNPIENIWGWLKEKVAKDFPTSKDELIESLISNWEKVTPNFLYPFIDSLRDRCNVFKERKGDHTGY